MRVVHSDAHFMPCKTRGWVHPRLHGCHRTTFHQHRHLYVVYMVHTTHLNDACMRIDERVAAGAWRGVWHEHADIIIIIIISGTFSVRGRIMASSCDGCSGCCNTHVSDGCWWHTDEPTMHVHARRNKGRTLRAKQQKRREHGSKKREQPGETRWNRARSVYYSAKAWVRPYNKILFNQATGTRPSTLFNDIPQGETMPRE